MYECKGIPEAKVCPDHVHIQVKILPKSILSFMSRSSMIATIWNIKKRVLV